MLKKIASLMLLAIFFLNAFAIAQTTYVTKSGYFAAVTEKDFDKAVEYVAQRDNEALGQLMKTKRVFPLKGNMEVYLEECGIFSGKVKIRPKGLNIEVWTFHEAISEK